MSPRFRDVDYLKHILEAIARVQRYAPTRDDFFGSEQTQDAVMRNIEVVGEAASKLSPAFTEAHTHVPWRAIQGMRNRLIHGYFEVNLNVAWNTVERDLPELKTKIAVLLEH
jgi:uncharacterized protein with HEPN domain